MEPASHPSMVELDVAQLIIMALATIMTLLSVAIFVEEAFYLTRKIRCPIKMKTLRWSSSAPTVSWGVGVVVGHHLRGPGLPKGCQPTEGGEQQCAKLASPPGCVCGQLLRAVVPALHDGGGDGYHSVSIAHPGAGALGSPRGLTCLPPPPPAQVLLHLLLPPDAGHGGGLRGEGGGAQHPEGCAHGGQHRALLLLLPLPAPNHHEQVRPGVALPPRRAFIPCFCWGRREVPGKGLGDLRVLLVSLTVPGESFN